MQLETRDLEMLKTPARWPRWPYLPLKRPVAGGDELAVVCESGHGLKIAVGANLFMPIAGLDWRETTAERVVADGWLVD